MPRNFPITSRIEFRGDANEGPNVRGDFDPERKCVEYLFTELALDTTNLYTQNLDTTSTIALASGGLLFTTAATDNKVATQSFGGIWWYAAKNPTVEMRFQVNDITNIAIFAGFSDAVTEAAATMPFALATATLTDTCTDGVGFLFDTDQTLDYFNIVNTKNGTQAFSQLASTFVPVNATDLVLRVGLDSAAKATFWWNGVACGIKSAAVTAATPLIPFFGIKNMSASAHTATLKYVRIWQDM